MESKNPLRHILAIVVSIIPLVYLGYIWNDLPQKIAIHFSASGTADRFGDRMDVLIQTFIMTGITLLAYILVVNAHILDKKRTKGVKPPMFDTIAFATVVFMSVISLGIIVNGLYPDESVLTRMILPAIGMFFVFMGNVMHSIKRNRFVGIRVPWTLNDDDNWRKTHQLGSKLFFVGGILIILVSLGFSEEIAAMFMTGTVLLIATTTIVYSYYYYKTNQKTKAQ